MRIDYELRPGTTADLAVIQRVLYEATTWDSTSAPPIEIVIEHPELVRYYKDWGRRGDLAVIAAANGEVAGAAICRLFTQDDHGHGFVDEDTPELGVAVWEGHRRQGLGSRLMTALGRSAAASGFAAISLSVNHGNPATGLYRRLGYEEVSSDENSLLMLKQLVSDGEPLL